MASLRFAVRSVRIVESGSRISNKHVRSFSIFNAKLAGSGFSQYPLVSSVSGLSRPIEPFTVRRFASAAAAPVGGVVSFNLADIGEGIAECEIIKWHVKQGDTIKQFDLLCEVQSDKASVEITSRYDGIVARLHHNQGDMAKVGFPLVDIDTGGSGSPASQPAASAPPAGSSAPPSVPVPSATMTGSDGRPLATPAVRRLAREHKISLADVAATGRDGRILKEDVLQFISTGGAPTRATALNQPPASASPAVAAPAPRPAAVSSPASAAAVRAVLEDRVVPVTGYGKAMIKSMTAAAAVPHFGYSDEIAMDRMRQLRADCKAIADARGVKLTFMPFFLKAASMALRQYPILNSSFDAGRLAIVYKASHNIGVAIDSPNGLIVPNIKNCQDKSVFEIAQELHRLQKAAQAGAMSPADLSGGTFTLSNIGSIGGTYASPVLVLPEVAIGAIGKIQKLPRFDSEGRVVPVHIMQISWSADHRVIDGATMANFSNLWKQYLENPNTIILDMK
eukprot:TRINITY_DN2288_c0_g1_i1.p1 TRINITY_DN2288_c0_g1~~TRINITY_DN2288_c0_g1_i1.p1  ORF type:complete len:508 (-),score=64.27 TRINITY_DN2288_c0_g1_i1:276-1799(-)